jgi:hypothetical protein
MTEIASWQSNPLRAAGFWLALVMGLLQAVYAVRAFVDPSGFATYRGTPLMAEGDTDWVQIYASRTLFLALIVGLLLARMDLATLKWVALLGVVMPISDTFLAKEAGASIAVVSRHIATVVYLLVTSVALFAWCKRNEPDTAVESSDTAHGSPPPQ